MNYVRYNSMASLVRRLVFPFSDITHKQADLLLDGLYSRARIMLVMLFAASLSLAAVNYSYLVEHYRSWFLWQALVLGLLAVNLFLIDHWYVNHNIKSLVLGVLQTLAASLISWVTIGMLVEPQQRLYNLGMLMLLALFGAFTNRANYKLYVLFLSGLVMPVFLSVLPLGPIPATVLVLLTLVLAKFNYHLFKGQQSEITSMPVAPVLEDSAPPAAPPSVEEIVASAPDVEVGVLKKLINMKHRVYFNNWRLFVADSDQYPGLFQHFKQNDFLYFMMADTEATDHARALVSAHLSGYLTSIFHRLNNPPPIARLAQHLQAYLRTKKLDEPVNAVIGRLDQESIEYVTAGELNFIHFEEYDEPRWLNTGAPALNSQEDITLGKRRLCKKDDKFYIFPLTDSVEQASNRGREGSALDFPLQDKLDSVEQVLAAVKKADGLPESMLLTEAFSGQFIAASITRQFE